METRLNCNFIVDKVKFDDLPHFGSFEAFKGNMDWFWTNNKMQGILLINFTVVLSALDS